MENRSEKNTHKKFLESFKEFKTSTIVGGLFILVSCLVSYFMGYARNPENIKFILGFPDWVFFGVLLPWTFIVLFTVFYSIKLMKGDD